MEPIEDFIPLSKEDGVQHPCTEVLRVSVDRQSIVDEFDIDLNALLSSKNFKLGPCFQIHPVLIETNVDGDDGYDNNGPFDHEVEDYSDPDLDKILDDIDDKGVNENDPDAAHASEFSEYLAILHSHRLAKDPKHEELFGYSLDVSIDCKVVVSKLTLYIGEYWRSADGYNWLKGDMHGETNAPFQEWLGTMKSWQWAQSFDDRSRYGHMTTNLEEAVNSILNRA
ncbi:hypothetical protein GOBAR_AA27173 [Gossypium barbadense]|uniref:Uncharacterized protein n=1 Tax=Gossypium barbadense TaxID=3634 RepID=A0A2P5WQX5_GOSBA|nr:hypothetical protein GOBAR_AA27173 [Gossypium barbadense]